MRKVTLPVRGSHSATSLSGQRSSRMLIRSTAEAGRTYEQMLDSVKRRRSVTSKLDMPYHEFSVGKGFETCMC